MTVLDAYPWVAEVFGPVTEETGGAYVNAPCPLGPHGSARVRFWLSNGKAAGKLCLKCFAGCPALEILRAKGLGYKHCYPAATDWKAVKQDVVARYRYRDEAGVTLYETVRLEPGRGGRDKDFRQRRPSREKPGGWEWSLGDVRRVLYQLPELVDPNNAGRLVCVCEGEKDCDSLKGIGVLATTNVCGARSEWLDAYSAALAGRDVVVVEDRDAAGRRHANEVVGSLLAHAVRSVRRATLPGKDATAFLAALRGRGVTHRKVLQAELWAALQVAPRWEPAAV